MTEQVSGTAGCLPGESRSEEGVMAGCAVGLRLLRSLYSQDGNREKNHTSRIFAAVTAAAR